MARRKGDITAKYFKTHSEEFPDIEKINADKLFIKLCREQMPLKKRLKRRRT